MPSDLFCIKCRYQLKGLSENRCPECGCEFDPNNPLTYAVSAWMLHPAHTLVGGALLLLIFAWCLNGAGDVTMFLDINSLLWVVGVVAAGLWMCFGPFKTIKAIKDGVLGYRYDNVGNFSTSIAVLARGYQLTWAAGLSGTLLGLVTMLSNMDDPAAIGPGMAVSLLASIYAVILAEFFLQPVATGDNLARECTNGSGAVAYGAPEIDDAAMCRGGAAAGLYVYHLFHGTLAVHRTGVALSFPD